MLNFLQKSLFSRGGNERKKQPDEPETQVLAVWGSPGSGKTTVSVKLALRLAEQHRNAALLLCDMTAPMLPCVCPPSSLDSEKSLGSILAAAHVTDSLIKQNCITHKRLGSLVLIGMLKGENAFTYPAYSAELATELIARLREIAPYIIIDCGSVIASDILSAVSLMEADSVLRLVNCDLKSVSYLSSQLPLLKDNKWDADKQYRVASNVRENEASGNIEQVLGGAAFRIPHSEELAGQALEGDLFRDLALKESRGFRREIDKISKEVFGI